MDTFSVSSEQKETALTFQTGPYRFCVPAADVVAIITVPDFRSLPKAPSSTVGLFTYRGQVVHITSLRRKFGLNAKADPGKDQLIIARISCGLTGFWVDEVLDIVPSADHIVPANPILKGLTHYHNMAVVDDQIYLITDFEQIFQTPDLPIVDTSIHPGEAAQNSDQPAVPTETFDAPPDTRATVTQGDTAGEFIKKTSGMEDRQETADGLSAKSNKPAAPDGNASAVNRQPSGRTHKSGRNRLVQQHRHQSVGRSSFGGPRSARVHRNGATYQPGLDRATRNGAAGLIRTKTALGQNPAMPAVYSKTPSRRIIWGSGLLMFGLVLLIGWGLWPKGRPELPSGHSFSAARMKPLAIDSDSGSAALVAIGFSKEESKPSNYKSMADAHSDRRAVTNAGSSDPTTTPAPISEAETVVINDSGDAESVSPPPGDATPSFGSDTAPPPTDSKPSDQSVSEWLRIDTADFTLTIERPPTSVAPETPHIGSQQMSQPVSIQPHQTSGAAAFTHIVVRGDTLWDIAAYYLGNPFRYPELARLSRIKDPHWIFPGDRIRILKKGRLEDKHTGTDRHG